MNWARAIVLASAASLVSVDSLLADDEPKPASPLQTATGIATRLSNPKVRADLKLTAEQEKEVLKNRWKWCKDITGQEIDAFAGPDQHAKCQALIAQRADEAYAAAGKVLSVEQIARLKQINLQSKGITMFDHPEIRKALHVDLDQWKKLREADKKVRAEVGAEISSLKMPLPEAHKKWNAVIFGVPDQVREVLSSDQRTKLAEMLGVTFKFNE